MACKGYLYFTYPLRPLMTRIETDPSFSNTKPNTSRSNFNLISKNIQNIVFWDVAPCGSGLKRRYGGTYRLHLQGR
jgi:hypothetical protein